MELIQIAIINVFAKLLKFLFEIGTSFFVSKDTYGEFALILSYILIFTKISSFGIQNIMVRDVPKYSNQNYISYLFFNSSVVISLVAITLAIGLYQYNFSYIREYPQIFIIFWLISLTILYSTYLRSIQKVKLWIYFQDIQLYIIYFLLLGVLYFIEEEKISIDFILNIYTVAVIGTFLSVIIFIRLKEKLYLISKLSYYKMEYIVTHSLPVLFTGLTYLVISRIDIIMLERYVSLELVGEYNIIARVTLQVLFFNQVIVSYYYPRLAKMFSQKKSIAQISAYNRKFLFLSFFSVSLVSFALFIGIYYFSLFDLLNIKNREIFFNVFVVLTIAQVIYSAIFFYGNILIYIHKQKMEYFNNFIVLSLAVILNILLIPNYGVLGASIATSVALILGNILQMLQVRYFTGSFFV